MLQGFVEEWGKVILMYENRIAVIGAGPAGMMAAIAASEFAKDVALIEKNPSLGRKLLLSGKGRCNLTNACELGEFLEHFSKNGDFLRDAFKCFFNRELMDFFKSRGLGLKTERQLRVFPLTNTSSSVVTILKKELGRRKVKVFYDTAVEDIIVTANKVSGIKLAHGAVIPVGKVILATGGVSYRFTGSTGEGINIARKLGHKIEPLRPALVPLVVKQGYVKSLEGVTLKNIRLKFSDGSKQIVSDIGELLFTSFGVSGPLVISLSGKIADWILEGGNIFMEIDLKPALSFEQLEARLLREFKASPKKNIKNVFKDLLPQRLVSLFLKISAIIDKQVSDIKKEERQKIINLLKCWRLDIAAPRPINEAMVTKGGVSLKDIDPRTLQSRKISGLYFAGEIIDVDADTGGFNLQAAFSTGYLAGKSAAL